MVAKEKEEPVKRSRLLVCYGPPLCMNTSKDGPCEWCYVVNDPEDESTDQIIANMRKVRVH